MAAEESLWQYSPGYIWTWAHLWEVWIKMAFSGIFCWVVMLFWLEGVWLSQVDLIEENSRSFTFNPQVQSFKIHQSRLCVTGLRPKAFNTFDILHFGCCISSPFSHANVSSGRCNPRDISTQEIEAPESNCSIYAFTKCNGFERSSDPQLAI